MRLILKFLPEQHPECIAAAKAVVYLKCLFKSFGIYRPIPSIALTILAIAAALRVAEVQSVTPYAVLNYIMTFKYNAFHITWSSAPGELSAERVKFPVISR